MNRFERTFHWSLTLPVSIYIHTYIYVPSTQNKSLNISFLTLSNHPLLDLPR
jgi:hypothetical protein